ncbi:unnamed protein product, partial [Symbiodinium sp. CCMP2456]
DRKELFWKEATRRAETGTTFLHVPLEKYTLDVRRHVQQACEKLKRDADDADEPCDEPPQVLVLLDLQSCGCVKQSVSKVLAATLANLDPAAAVVLWSNIPAKRHKQAIRRGAAATDPNTGDASSTQDPGAASSSCEEPEEQAEMPDNLPDMNSHAVIRWNAAQKTRQLVEDRQVLRDSVSENYTSEQQAASLFFSDFVLVHNVAVQGRLTTEGTIVQGVLRPATFLAG